MLKIDRLFLPVLLAFGMAFLLHHATTVTAAASQTFQVTEMFDSDDHVCDAHCSLREAVEAANTSPGHDNIYLPPSGFFNFVILTLGELTITDDVSVFCDSWLIEPGNGGSRAFSVTAGASMETWACAMRGGGADEGGYIHNSGVITLRNGLMTHNDAVLAGGAIYNDGGSVYLRNMDVEDNSAENGGAIYNNDGTVTSDNSIFTNNDAAQNGGALLNVGGSVTFLNSDIVDSDAANGGAIFNTNGSLSVEGGEINSAEVTQWGGGIYNDDGLVEVRAVDMLFNSAENGGALYNNGGSVEIIDAKLWGNNATGDGGGVANAMSGTLTVRNTIVAVGSAEYGGGIHMASGEITVTQHSTITTNNASRRGGGIFQEAGQLLINDTTLIYNRGDGRGGGLNVEGGTTQIIASYISRNGSDFYGGGLSIVRLPPLIAQVTIQDSTFDHNKTENFGAGIFNEGQLQIENSSLLSNSAEFNGGGLLNAPFATVEISDSLFQGNTAGSAERSGIGGGVFNQNSLTAIRTTWRANQARKESGSSGQISGGAIYNGTDADAHLSENIITANSAPSTGGGIHNSGTLVIDLSQISGNSFSSINNTGTLSMTRSAVFGGGLSEGVGLRVADGQLWMSQSAVYDNVDGGIYIKHVDAIIENSTISGNYWSGLAVYGDNAAQTTVHLSNTTIADNFTGGFFMDNGTVVMANSIIEGGDASSNDCVRNNGVFIADMSNLDTDGSCANATTGVMALEPLADNGGPTPTHNLLSFSDAIGLGNVATCAAVGGVDQRGLGRTGVCDAGALESDAMPTAVVIRGDDVRNSAEIAHLLLLLLIAISLTTSSLLPKKHTQV